MKNLRLVAALGKHASLGTPFIRVASPHFQPCLCNKPVGLERESKEKKWRIKVRKKDKFRDFGIFGFQMIFWSELMVKFV